MAILEGKVAEGATVTVDVADGELTLASLVTRTDRRLCRENSA